MCWWISVWVPHVHLQNATINHSATACNTPRPWQQRMDEIKEPLCINTPPCPVHTTGNCFTTNANTNDIMTPAQPSSTYEKHHTDKLPMFIYENNRREDVHGLLKQKRKLNTAQQNQFKKSGLAEACGRILISKCFLSLFRSTQWVLDCLKSTMQAPFVLRANRRQSFLKQQKPTERLIHIRGAGDEDQCAIISGCQYSNRGHSNSFPLAF